MKRFNFLSTTFLTTYVFWLLVFVMQRIWFLTFHYDRFSKIEGFEIFQSFIQGFRLDLSTIGYLMILPLIVMLIVGVFVKEKAIIVFKWVVFIEIIIVAIIHSAELNAYGEWGHKLSSRVFMHLGNPSEVVRTTGYGKGILSLLMICIESVLSIFIFNKSLNFINNKFFKDSNSDGLKGNIIIGLTTLMWLATSFICMRGGTQQIPINIDSAYFSNKNISNDLSVNSSYYFGNSFFLFNKNNTGEYVPKRLSKEEKLRVLDYYKQYPNESSVLTTKTPNIVFIIFEGWSSHAIGSITGNKTATPFFDDLTKSGILFTDCYAANTTSEIGNATIFSGFTGIPEAPISLYPEKHRNLTAISDILTSKKYSSSYVFSGDLKYGNIKGFLMDHHFEKIQDEEDFNQNLHKGKLNFYDEDLFDKLLVTIKGQKPPFLACAFTGSTHFPYDYPNKINKFKGEESDYLNSMIYADACLRDFFKAAKKKAWYKNTIFVLVSDHGHATPECDSPYDPQFFRIPFAIVGEPIKKEIRGMKINKVCSQADVSATLLHQLKIPSNGLAFSRNAISPKTMEGAFLSTIRGVGFVSSQGGYLFNFDAKKCLTNSYTDQSIYKKERRLGDACFYELYKYFNLLDSK